MSSVKVQVKLDTAIRNKLAEMNNPTMMLAIHNILAKKCDPYVPFLEGNLSQTITVSDKGVRYIQPYARRQYYGDNFNFTLDKHPLATSRWDKAMLRDHGEEFNAEVQDIIVWRLRQ